jgi:UDP-glucose 4-epimerase
MNMQTPLIARRAARRRTPVLVTGGAGYIGSHAVLALLDAGWPVVVLDNLSTGFRKAVDRRAAFVEGDVGDPALTRKTLARYDIGAIMHFAGSIIVPESVDNPLKYYRNNTANSRALIESAVAERVPHFIFSSTAAVYGIPSDKPVAEDWPTRPANPYGTSKLMTEMMLADTAAAHPINYCALRYFNVAGADPKGRAGQSTAGATNLIKVATEVASGARARLDVFGDDYPTPDGTGVRDFIHVSDLADAHLRALELLVDDPSRSHVLNCGYGSGHSVREVIESVERVSGRTVAHRIVSRRAGDIAMMVADNSALVARSGWEPRFASLDQIVADALAWEAKLSKSRARDLKSGVRDLTSA